MTSVVENTNGWAWDFPVEDTVEGWMAFDALLARERDMVALQPTVSETLADEEFWSMRRCRERCALIAEELYLRVIGYPSEEEGGQEEEDEGGYEWDDYDDPCSGGVCGCCGRTRD